MRPAFTFLLAAAPLAAVTACGQPAPLYVDGAYVRLPAVAGRPGVAYFTVHGGKDAATLISVTSPRVVKSELHESMAQGGMASMAPIGDVPVPAKATLKFAPGGKHVMLFDINKSVQAGGKMTLVFTFSNNDRIEVEAPVIAAGDPPPK